MKHELLNAVVRETADRLTGRFLGRIFQLSKFSLAIDLGLRGTFLFMSVDPVSPRYYLIERRQKDLEKKSIPLSNFGQFLRARLGGAKLVEIGKDQGDRIVRLKFRTEEEHTAWLVVQLTGKTSNLFVLDESQLILDVLRATMDSGQQPGDHYEPPKPVRIEVVPSSTLTASSPSAQADAAFTEFDERRAFDELAKRVRAKARGELSKQKKLKTNLQLDLERHGNPETYKHLGDLLLANATTAIRNGQRVKLKDYYAEGAPIIEIEVDPNTSFKDEAARQFRQYTKAKRARETTAGRLTEVERRIKEFENREREIEALIQSRDSEALSLLDVRAHKVTNQKAEERRTKKIPGIRRYLSSDGYEVWVGRAAKDNDNLTFRLARPHDLWLHAGDYPGSHVIVRNPTRKEIPHRTLIEAAQLAARFSQASEDSRVVVHHAERKFLSKPKGAAPGLVRMSSYRSITVEPKESIPRLS